MASSEQLIPRVIHRIWLGSEPIPELFEDYADTWREHHPRWELKLWGDDNLPALSCQAAFERARTFKSRYDVVRLEIMRQMGGVVIDMDVQALRSIEPLLGGVRAFVGRTSSGSRVGNQVIGAVPNHPLFEYAVKRLGETTGTASNSSEEAGPAFLSRVVNERPDDVTIFPRDYFYSPLTIEPPRNPEKFPDIYAVHHSAESYRPGPEGQVVRLERQLRKAQKEIERLQALAGEGTDVPADARDASRRLAAVTSTRWWRLGRRLGVIKIN